MTDRQLSRRTVLKTSAAALAAGATSGLAGCSGIPGLGGGGGGSGSSEIQNWAYAPGEIADQDNYRASYRNYGAHRDNEDEFDSEYYDRVENQYAQRYGDFVDIDFEDADWSMRLGVAQVLSADHEVDSVVDHLEDEFDYEEDDEVSGYTTILGPSERRAVAADGSLVLSVRAPEDAADAMEDFIATQDGEIDMYVDEEEDFADAITNVSGDVVGAGLGGFAEDVVATGNAATFNGETTNRQFARVYDEEDDYDQEELQERANEQDDASVSFNGRVVIFEGETDTDEYGVSSGTLGVPQPF